MIPRLLLLGCLLAGLGTRQVEGQSIVVGVGGELSAAVGSDIAAPVFADMRASGGHRLGSYTLRLSWDRNVLQYLDFDAGVFAQPQVQEDSAYYGVLYAAAVSVSGSDDVVDLLRLKFRVLAATSSTVSVEVKELSAAVSFTDLLGIVATLPSTFCGAIGRWGDLDGDSLSNSRDALAILSSVVGLTVAPAFVLSRGDVNGDNKVNSVDALIILSYAVGLDIFGQRVLVPIPGACGSAPQTTVGVLPDTADVTVGQRVHLKVQAKTASGVFVSLAVNWTVVDPGVAIVDQTGLLVGRGPGTTRAVAALGPGIRYSVPVVTRAKRGTWIVNAPVAKRNSVQLGTLRWPFSTPQRAFALAAEGDTIRVLPGTHDYEDYSDEGYDGIDFADNVRVGVTLIGDTLPDGTRPVLRGPADYYSTMVDWTGGLRGEVKNLILRNFYYGVDLEGLSTLTIQNVRVENPSVAYGYAVYAETPVDTIRILKSEFIGDTTLSSYNAVYIGYGAKLVQIQDSKLNYWGGGAFQGYDVDSLDVTGSEFSYNDYRGISLGASYRPSVAARISHSRFIDNYYDAIQVSDARRAALDHNFILQKRDNGIQISGPAGVIMTGSKLTSLGDSIRDRTGGYSWISTDALDSALVDSLWVESPADTAQSQTGTIRARYVWLRDSKLLNLYSTGVNLYGRTVSVSNTQFTGCAATACTWSTGTAINAYAYPDSGPALTVTNSMFSKLSRAIYAPSYGDSAGPFIVTGNTADSVSYFLDAYADSLVASNNVLTKIQSYGFYTRPSISNRAPRTAAILNNRVACTGVYGTGIQVNDEPARIENNVVTGCASYGIYANNTAPGPIATLSIVRDSVASGNSGGYGMYLGGRWRPTLYGNHVAGFYYGLYLYNTDSGTVKIDSNAVSGAGYIGMYLETSGSAVVMTGSRNRVANNTSYGIYDSYHLTGTRTFTDGAITGNGSYGVSNSAPGAFDATNNWWGNSGGPGVGGANTVSGPVTTTSFKTSDPTGTTPTIPAPAVLATAGLRGVSPQARPVDQSMPPSAPPPALDRAKEERRAAHERARRADLDRAARAIADRHARDEAHRLH